MRCQYCDEKKAVREVNYMNDKQPQFAWMCEECANEFALEVKSE